MRLKSRPLSTRLSPSYRHEAPLASTSELTAIPPATLAKVLIYEARDEYLDRIREKPVQTGLITLGVGLLLGLLLRRR